MQAFGLTLNNNMIEDMIKCVQNGQNVEITLGGTPSLHYGSQETKVSATPESLDYDLYLTDLADAGTKTQRLLHPTMSIFKKPPQSLSAKKATKVTAKYASRASSSGADSDLDTRAGAHTQKSGKGSKFVNGGPKGAKNLPTGRSAMASVLSSTTRSLPTSPALNGVSSPNPAFSASQQILEKNKGQRTVLVHELAVRDQSYEYLKNVWTGADSDLKSTVEKVADFNKTTEKWSLKKPYWKELDVWNYDYKNPTDRQSAIDGAIKAYDKQRMMLSDSAWERLLPQEDRGKNIVLSKLQASIAKQSTIPPAPKIAVQKAEDGNKSDIDSSKAKGEAMSRSASQPTSNKPKKISEREAQTKRLLSSNPKKPAPKKQVSKVKAAEEKGKRVLSEEFVYDTDTSAEDVPSSQNTAPAPKSRLPPKPTEKPIEKQIEKPVEKRSEKPAGKMGERSKEPPALKPKPKPVVRAPRAPAKALGVTNKSPQKRSREDEDSSSSSGAPLSKRIKPKNLPKPAMEPKSIKHRASDASQNSRGTNSTITSTFTMKSKNTSPTKSSPLATSPPTNASDLEERPSSQRLLNRVQQHPAQPLRNGERERERGRDRGRVHGPTNSMSTSTSATSSAPSAAVASKKRKDRESVEEESPDTTPTPPSKKPRISREVLAQALKFTKCYEVYEALHYEIAALKSPPDDKLASLVEMRDRLVDMKREIQQAAAASA
ncbi:hypothetical protein RRF57_008433 [Xylaria bambusicola]|uniref:Uncharacterized protein n=1 Tax=Xylaria bambusicola TaxID=326684 RepID=A0AAN7V1R5_9PEZI